MSLLSDTYTRLVADVLFPVHEKLKHHDTVARLKVLEKTQWYSISKINELQATKLRHFIAYIYQHVPYYQQLMQKNHLTPDDIQSASDLQKLPFLDKAAIRANFDQIKSDENLVIKVMATGGSTGEPLKFGLGNDRISHDVAAKWRATRWWDVDIGDKETVLWGSPVELGSQDRVRQLRDAMIRSKLVPAFDISDANAKSLLLDIQHFKPKMLFGYPSSMSLLAKYALDHHIDMTACGIKVAFVTSERLYDEQRKLIEQAFACPVANGYGGRDAGFLAHQCPSGNMHISAEDIIIEIVDDEGQPLPNGESGNIVVTHTSTSSFPFVRYQTGDVGAISEEPCPCGRGLPVLSKLDGRSTDFIIAPDGRIMHGLSLIYILREIEGIALYKIIQHAVDKIEIIVVRSEDYVQDTAEQSIIDGIRQRMGETVNIDIHYQTEIPREKSGKFRYVVSHVKP